MADLQRMEYRGKPPEPSSLAVKRASSPKIYPGPRRRKVTSDALGWYGISFDVRSIASLGEMSKGPDDSVCL